MKQEGDVERGSLMTKYDELKEKLDRREDELNNKNITFEKDQALY